MTVKFEKITLWTATETYGHDDRGLTALDHIMPVLREGLEECQILNYDAEDYKLVKVRKGKKHA
jgi:hypothetical protein